MAWGGLSEEPSPTRDSIFPAMGGYPHMGLAPTTKECRKRIMLDLGILIIPRLDCVQHHLSELYQVSPGGGRREYGPLGGADRRGDYFLSP